MKRITLKIILLGFLVMMVASMIPRLIINSSLELPERDVLLSNTVFVAMLFAVALAVLLFSLGLHHMIVKRIQLIEHATKRIEQGHFDVEIDVLGDDEIAHLATSFNQMIQSIKQSDAQSQLFVRHVSHEMKTPLSLLKGYADLLKEEPLSEEGHQYAAIISNEAERLSRLSKNLLDLSSMTESTIIQKEDIVQLDTLIKEQLIVFQLLFEDKQLKLHLDLLPITIHSNETYLKIMMKNLIENALMYTPSAHEVFIRMKTSDDFLWVEIENTGTYLTQEELLHIHEPFYTGHQKSSLSSGIGMTLVSTALKALQGELKVASNGVDQVLVTIKLIKN